MTMRRTRRRLASRPRLRGVMLLPLSIENIDLPSQPDRPESTSAAASGHALYGRMARRDHLALSGPVNSTIDEPAFRSRKGTARG